MRLLSFTSPFANRSGRIDFPWERPGDSIRFHLQVEDIERNGTFAELITNIDSNHAPESFRALAMTRTAFGFEIDVPVRCLGNYRAHARVSDDRGATFISTRDAELPDLLFRPRVPEIDQLAIEVVSLPNSGHTLADYPFEALKERGKNCVWLLPIFEPSPFAKVSPSDATGSPYAPLDFFSVRRDIARGEPVAELRAFIERAHDLGIKVVLDIALNHVGFGHVFKDLFVDGTRREVRENDFSQLACTAEVLAEIESRLADPSFPRHLEQLAPWVYGSNKEYPRGASSAARIAAGGWFEWPDTRQLNHGRRRVGYREFLDALTSPEHIAVQGWLERVLRFWAVDMKVDGFRLDHLAGLPRRMLEVAFNHLQADVDRTTPGRHILLIGEDWDTGHETQHFVDVLQAGWPTEIAAAKSNAELSKIVDNPWFMHLLALSNHDEDRPTKRWSSHRALFAESLLYLLGGPTMEVLGDHFGERERLEVRTLQVPLTLRESTPQTQRFAATLSLLARLRQSHAAFRGRERAWLDGPEGAICFARGRRFIVVANPHEDRTLRGDVLLGDMAAASLPVELAPLELRVLDLQDVGVQRALTPVDTGRRTFTYQGEPNRQVELAGDFVEWKRPIPMREIEPGKYQAELALAPGVYRYKLKLDQRHWVRDQSCVLIDHLDGLDNNLCVVGGITAPVLFAPDQRHLALTPEGSFTVHAEASADDPALIWMWLEREDGSAIPVAMHTVAVRNGRRLLAGRAELDPRALPELLTFDRARGPRFRLPAPTARPSGWWRHASFYGIFVDRWFRSDKSPADPRASSRDMPTGWKTFYGGDLFGIIESLPDLAALGIDAIVLTPIHCSDSSHRYDGIDLASVDPRLGGDDALERLIRAAHDRGIRVVCDFAVTHVDDKHPAFIDLIVNQEKSTFKDWFKVQRFPVFPKDPDCVEVYPNQTHLPVLNLESLAVREHVFGIAESLIRRGVDGLRLDAMNDLPVDFWGALRARVKAVNPDACLLGEVVIDRPHRFAHEHGADLITDFDLKETMIDFFAKRKIDAGELHNRAESARFRKGPYTSELFLAFLDNHDTSRFASIAGYYDRLRLALSYLLFRPESIWLTYGTEEGLCRSGAERELDDAWPDRLPMPLPGKEDSQTKTVLRTLLRLRRELGAFKEGDFRLVHSDGASLVIDRATDREKIRGYFNAGDEVMAVRDLPVGAELLFSANDPGATTRNALPARAVRFYRLPKAKSTRTARMLRVVDEEFRTVRLKTQAPPTRFYLNMTERCNISCQHCITDAPALTRSKTARTMSKEVLAALAPHLRHAHYVGLTHAGEPLMAPQLVPMLDILREVRDSEPTIVHLLTNGLLLTPDRFLELSERGVNSWSVSIDGMTAETHDRLRVGSKIEVLIERLREIAPLRKRLDTRMGLAWTVTAANVGELPALIALAKELQIDWLKLEELVEVNGCATALLPEAGVLDAALDRARRAAKDAGLRLLDHTSQARALSCQLSGDAVAREFSELDDFVNRMQINSCRLPWELVCVEPNGDVKPMSFHHPACGNVLENDLLSLWNRGFFVANRGGATRAWICNGAPSCAKDTGPNGW